MECAVLLGNLASTRKYTEALVLYCMILRTAVAKRNRSTSECSASLQGTTISTTLPPHRRHNKQEQQGIVHVKYDSAEQWHLVALARDD